MVEKKKKEKWGSIGAPGSKKRSEHLAKIRADKRVTQKQKDARAADEAKEDIQIIEEKVSDLDLLEEKVAAPTPESKKKAVTDIVVEEQKKMESPGEPGEPYVEYPY